MKDQPFKCTLSAESLFRLGEPIVVGFEIRNVGKDSCRVLGWGTPLEGDHFNFLKVSRDGIVLEYDGRLVSYGEPAEDDYITLRPGESRLVDVDISDLYPVDVAGEYTATLTTTLYDAYPVTRETEAKPKSRNERELHTLDRTSVTFTVEPGDAPRRTVGQKARLVEWDRDRGSDLRLLRFPFGPNIVEGTASERADTLVAHNDMLSRAVQAHIQLTTTSVSNNARYKEWFGVDGPITVVGPNRYFFAVQAYDDIRNIPSAMFPLPLTYDLSRAGCQSKWSAHTFRDSRTVWLCDRFFSLPPAGADSRRGTLMHEWSHSRRHTSDFAYGQFACRNLASTDPQKAIMNASNYNYFAESV